MKTIYFYTSNSHKFREISDVLKNHGIKLVRRNADFFEHGDTIEDVVTNKAKDTYKKIKKPLITEDTAIYFNAYRDFPGLYAKRIFHSLWYEGLLKLLEGKNRNAKFVTCICLADRGKYRVFKGTWNGRIDRKVNRASNVMAYERLFIPKGYSTALCRIPRDEKNVKSHRAKAAKRLGLFLSR